jgi:hypothetical protein
MPWSVKSARMTAGGLDAVIWGFNAAGRPFRPSDWCDRLAGVTEAFGQERKVSYAPYVRPVNVGDAKAVVVGAKLAELEAPLYRFLVNFARDNALVIEFRAGALDDPGSLMLPNRPPTPAPRASAEPQEPV